MKGSLIVVGFFALGCLLGWSGWLPDVVIENDITVYVLYLLMFQVGLSIGSDKKQKDRIRNRFADLLQKFDFAQKIACGNTREHNSNDSKHR